MCYFGGSFHRFRILNVMRIAVLPLSSKNNEKHADIVLAMQRVGLQPSIIGQLITDAELAEFAGYVVVGDFEGENSADLPRHMATLRGMNHLGKPILGIAKGACVLVEAGLVPGLVGDQVGMAITMGNKVETESWAHMRLVTDFQYNAFTRFLSIRDILSIQPVPASIQFVIGPGLLAEMQVNGLCLLQYCDHTGKKAAQSTSSLNIAAVANKSGNVMAMLSYPEGDAIFLSMRDYIAKGHVERVVPLYFQPR
jgi:phosphoribosylformylglycinamidine (FGAM) synthase-like amidotransferase family enzyme